MAGQGPSADAAGDVYFMTGNSSIAGDPSGTNTAPSPGFDLGESFVKLRGSDLTLGDWFTPKNFVALNKGDEDLGSSGPVLIPGTNRLLGGGKEGRIYLMNTNDLGHFDTGTDKVLQSFQATDPNVGTHHIHGAPVYVQTGATPLDARIFVWGESNQVRAFRMTNGVFQTTPDAQSTLTDDEVARGGMPGGILTYSGTGATNGIVWGTHVLGGAAQGTFEAGRFWAFDAATLRKLWSSTDVPARDDIGRFAKFAPPTGANGRVYVASFSNEVSVYGLLE
jgi:hypothetical protein